MTPAAGMTARGHSNPRGIHLRNAPSSSRTLVFGLLLGLLMVFPATADSLPPAALGFPSVESSPSPLEDLLVVPGLVIEWTPESGDEALVAAVAQGNDPDLEPPDPFRKRKMDLFSTERPVMIGRTEMVLRLRLRPSRKETMSLELHF